jgi:hypothetical protein
MYRDPLIPTIFIRLTATEETKSKRGWVRASIDEDTTECELDNYTGLILLLYYIILYYSITIKQKLN